MQIRLSVAGPDASRAPTDLLVAAPAGAPLAELAGKLAAAAGRSAITASIHAGAQALPGGAPLGEPPLVEGALVGIDAPTSEPLAPGLLELHVVGGPDAGAVHLLAPGDTVVGRGVEADIRLDDTTASRAHACVTVGDDGVRVRDLGSTNGTLLDGAPVGASGASVPNGALVRVGASSLVVSEPEDPPLVVLPDGCGHLELNRPPRLPAPAPRVEVRLPAAPRAPERMRLPMAMVAAPLGMGGVLYLTFDRNAAMVLLMALSPAMYLANAVSDKLGGRRRLRRDLNAYAKAMDVVRACLAEAIAAEVRLRRDEAIDPALLLLHAQGPRGRLWERRCTDDDFLHLRLGTADLPSRVTVHAGPDVDRPTDAPIAPDVPVTVPLAELGVLGLAGPRDRLEGLTRHVVGQLAGLHSPRDLEVVVISDGNHVPSWAWARWLPHLRPSSGQACTRLLGLEPAQAQARVGELLGQLDNRQSSVARVGVAAAPRWPGRSVVVILDGARRLRAVPGVARLLEDGPSVGMYAICLAPSATDLPAECAATAVVHDRTDARLTLSRSHHDVVRGVVADLVPLAWAERLARALAPVRDATPDGSEGGLPTSVRLLELVDLDEPTAEEIATRWVEGGHSTTAVLGAGVDGRFTVDLRRDGPHVLVAGTTGSGKSELLQTLVASLALTNRPDELAFILIDYKGGSCFQDCARLPHTVGLVTDLDGHLTERALRSLDAELERRERLLLAAGVADLDSYRGGATLPRLVIVVDEFATLVEELPTFVQGLVGIAQRGRSLGVHLVLATQRPSGVVSADIRANTDLRIALRVTDPGESQDVVDVTDAALIPRQAAGRGLLRTAAGAVTPFQTGRVSGGPRAPERVEARVVVQSWTSYGSPPPAASQSRSDPGGPTDLARLVDAVRAAAQAVGTKAAPSPWLPPLPTLVTVDSLASDSLPPTLVPLGLTDVPRRGGREVFGLDLETGSHLLVAGGARSGRSSLLRTLAGSVADRHSARDVHLYGLDCAGGALHALAMLPHCGTVVGRDDAARSDRLLARLLEEVARRQRLLLEVGVGSVAEQRRAATPDDRLPWMILLIDGWEGFLAAFEKVEHGRPVEAVMRLLREGSAAGLRVVVTGDRAALTGRVASLLPARVVLRMADRMDYSLAGIPAAEVPDEMCDGRALLPDGALETQLALLATDSGTPAQVDRLRAIGARASARAPDPPRALRPMLVAPLPARVALRDIAGDAQRSAGDRPLWLLVGVGGDEPEPVGVDLDGLTVDGDGPAFVVAGAARSGRSTTLVAMTRWLASRGTQVVVVTTRRSPLRELQDTPGVLAALGPEDADTFRSLLAAATSPLVTVIDDAEGLLDSPLEAELPVLLRGDGPPCALVLAGNGDQLTATYRGITVEARAGRCGLLLGPSRRFADMLGAPAATSDEHEPVGRGVLVVRGRSMPVQAVG